MSRVQDALEARKKQTTPKDTNPKVTSSKVANALKSYSKNKTAQNNVVNNFINRINSEINSFGKLKEPDWGDASSVKTSFDNQSNLYKISEDLLKSKNAGEIDDKTYNELMTELDKVNSAYHSYVTVGNVRSQFASEDEYNKYLSGWLREDAEFTPEAIDSRKARYESNKKRIEEITEEIKEIEAGRKHVQNADLLLKELERLSAETLQYERTQYGIDRNYIPITEEVTNIASNRNFPNASMDELWEYDAVVKDIKGRSLRYDYDGNMVDVGGRIIYEANHPIVKAMRENNLNSFYDSLIGDKLGMYLSASQDDLDMAYERLIWGGNEDDSWAILMNEGETNAWKELSPDEITIYYYKLNTEGKEAAYKYLEDMTVELTRRATKKRADEISKAPLLEQIGLNIASIPMSVFGGVIGGLGDIANAIEGKEYNPYSAAHSWSNDASAIRTDTTQDINTATGNAALPWVGTTFGDVYQSIMSAGDSVMASFIPGGHRLLGLNAATSEMKELYERGGSTAQILIGGILAGAAESFFEKFSIGELNKLKNMDKKTVKSLADIFVRASIMGGVEASEEMATEIANTISDALVMGSQSDWAGFETFVKNVVNAGIGGFISGGLMGDVASSFNYAIHQSQVKEHGQEIIDNGGAESLKDLALEMYGKQNDIKGSIGVNIASKLGDKVTAKNVGRLSEYMEDTITSQNEASFTKAFVEKGLSKKSAAKVAKYLTDNNSLSKEDIATIEGSKKIQSLIDEVLEDSNLDMSDASIRLAAARVGVNPVIGKTKNTSVTENPPIKETATEAKFEGATEAELVADIARDKKKTLKGFTEEAESAMVNGYTGEVTPSEYSEAFTNAYKMGASGVPSSALVRIVNSKAISERTAFIAYALGQNSNKALQNVSNNGTINSQINDGGNNDEGIRLRDSGERNGSENSEGQVSAVEGGSGQTESRRKTARIADKEAARLLNEGREVKVADLGILGGSKEQTVRVLENVEETDSMKKARAEAEARGVKVTFFVGDNLVIEEDGELISARAYITLNGKHVFVRVDHSNYTAEQLMGHELGHYKIHKGEVDINAVRERIKELVDGDYDELAKLYEAAYAGSGYNADQIWEECICDSLGNMNVFSETESEKFIESLLPKVKTAAESTAKSPTQTRGSPDGKASRDTYTKTQYNNFGWVRDNDILNEGYWDNFTRNYADAVYSKGFDRITPDGEYMIEIYDQNVEERLQVIDHIVYAKGSIRSPKVTRILQIYEYDESKLDEIRRDVYETERAGIQRQAEGIFEVYVATDFGSNVTSQRSISAGQRYNNQLGTARGRGSKAASRVKEYIFEVEDREVSGKASRELDTDEAYSRLFDMQGEENALRQSIKEIESSAEFKEQMSKLSEAIDNDNVDAGVKAYEAWKKAFGYGELIAKRDKLQNEIAVLRKDLEDNRVASAKNAEQEAIAKSGLSEADYFRKLANKEFGYTPYFYDAGYILSNGKMLNFSGEKGKHFGTRGEDHRAIGIIYADTQGTDALVRFMNDGNIRIMAESPGLDISSNIEPSKEQYSTIRSFIYQYADKEYFNIDLSDENGRVIGSLEYDGRINPTRIINDLKHYYETGEIREQSSVDKYRFSRELDSLGNQLSEEQQEYFKDSKVRDEEGRLFVCYHGTRKADFFKFNRNYNFFTDSSEMADSYSPNGEKYTGYLNIRNPFIIDANGDRWSRIAIDDDTKKMLDNYGSSTFKEGGKWRTTPADIAAAIEEGIEEGEFDYDGIIIKNVDDTGSYAKTSKKNVANDYITFSSNQFKNIDNKTPTKNSDIRYSRELDTEYLSAVERGDMETAQRMVDEAAKDAGYTVKGMHATNAEFTEFDISKTSENNFHGKGIYFTNSIKDLENNYENYEGPDPWQKIEARAYELAYDKYGISYDDTLTSDNEIINKLNECFDEAIEEFNKTGRRITAYLRFENPLILEKGMQIPYDYSGYDGIIDKQVYENIGHSGMDENTIHYVVLNPKNIKSADPVTYDDNGAVIPLSERFNTEKSDIRFSRELEIMDLINEQAGEKRETDNTKQQNVAQARDDLEKLNVGKGEIMALMKLADEMYENYNGQSTISDFRYGLFETTKVALNGIDEGLEAAYNIIHTLAREVAYNPKRLTGEAVILDSIQKQIKGIRMSVSDADKTSGEFTEYGGYNEFRKRHLGKFILANEGTKVDVQYQELQELYGEAYFPEVNTISEMLLRMAEIVDRPLSEYMAESESELDSIADGIAVTLFERLGDVWSKISRRGKVVINKTAIDQFSNRTLLANALETVVQNEVEAKKLEEYKANIDKMNAEQAKLNDLRAQIKEISFSKGKRDTEKLKALQEEATKTANRITVYDGKLLKLEATKALKDVLEREKLKAYRIAAQKGRERLHANVEGRKKTEARHKIINVTRDLDALLNRGTKEKNVKIDLRDLVSSALDISDRLFATDEELLLSGIKTDTTAAEKDAIAEYLDLYSEYHSYDDAVSENKEKRKELRSVMNELKKEFSGVLERERNRINETQASTAYDALLTALKTLKGSDVSYISAAIENVPEVFEYIETLKKKIGTKLVKDMTLEDLNSLYKALKSVKHLVSNANKMFGAERNESLEELSVKAHAEVSKNEQKKYISAAEDSMSMMSWNNLKPIYLMERLKSETLVNLFADVLEGESQWARDVQDAHDYAEEQKKKYNYKDWDLKKLHEFTSNTGQTYELSLEQMLSIYAYVKRGEDALEHLRNGGFVFGKIKRKKKGGKVDYYLNDKTAYKVPDTVIFEIIGNPINAEKGILTDEQKAYVDAMQEYLSSTMGVKGNEVSRQLYGIDLFTEGNYLPMRSEKDFLEKARMQDEGKIKIKNKGFTNQLQKGAKNPIVLEDFTDLWGSHVAEMSSYHAFTLPLENLGRVLNYQNKTSEFEDKESLRTAIGNAFGDAAQKAVDQMIDDINGGARVDPREAGFKKAISLHKKAKVMLSLSVAIQQPTSILRAMALIDPKHFVGTPKFSNKHWNEIKQYAPVAIIKEMGHFDTGMGQSSSDWITGKSTWRDTVDNFSSWLPERADMITWIGIWDAVKREIASKNPTMNTNSKEFLELAGKRFEEIIRYTQVYDSTLSRSSNMRSKSAWMQMATSFLAEPTTALNMREAALRSGNKKRIARTTAAIYSAALLNAILVALPYAMRDDDEDETFLEKYASSVASSFWGNINPIAALPFFRDIWSLSLGYDVERTDMSLASDILDSFEGMLREITKEEADSAAITDAVLKLLGDVSAMLGIPIGNLYREAKAILNTIGNASNEAESTLESVLDELYEMFQNEVPIWSKFPGETRGDKLYDAILEGDDVYVERLKGYYKDKNAVNSAIRKALREHDPRINEAAIALNNGERLEYNRIIDEIVDEGFFEETNVMSAILQEYEDMQPEEEKEPTEEKEQSRYEVIWVLEDILNSDMTEANAMKDEIIQTHIDNGKSQREAENAFKSSFRTEVKNYYLEDRVDSSTALKLLMQHAGNTEEEALNKIQYWNFKKQYTDSELAESQVTKYYETIDKLDKSISSVLSVSEYEEALDKLAEATGVDLNGDGKTDKDTLKKEIVSIIDSMPFTKEQKDALYYIKYPNGNIRKDTPWH